MVTQAPLNGLDWLNRLWRTFSERECVGYSPLYAAIAESVAADNRVLKLIARAPKTGRQPNVLLAAVHYLLLGGDPHPLGQIYAGQADPAPAPRLFRDMVLARSDEVERLLATRRTQTNEPGRAALLLPGLAAAAAQLGPTVGVIDAGCSAGINLLMDRFHVIYQPGPDSGPAESTVQVECAVLGESRPPLAVPFIADRLGIDLHPVDLSREDQARWLKACVWPDTGRSERTAAAIALVRSHKPTIVNADMVSTIEATVDRFEVNLPVVVVTTWACAYLDSRQRSDFLAALTRCSTRRPLSWLSAEPPGVVAIVPPPAVAEGIVGPFGVLGLVTFDKGAPDGRSLAVCHPHGAWIRWTDT